MSERIKQLWEQALRWSGENVNRNLYSNYEIEQKEYEKFAQLIVRECMDICYRTDTEYEGHKVKSTVIASKVAEHFGVEE
jgi:hypothetical protein